MKIQNDFISINIFTTPLEDVVTVGFRLVVKHKDPLRKYYDEEKTQVFKEVLGFNYRNNEIDIIRFISSKVSRLLKNLQLVLESKIARIVDEAYMISFPFTEYRLEKL